MKIQLETALFQVPFGSRLYGTNTPSSDYDFKVVCLPSFEDLLMNKKLTNRVVKPEGWQEGDKMLPEQAESEYIPLQVFLDQFFEGQTYAVEIAFAVLSDMHTMLEREYGELASTSEESYRVQRWMTELVKRFLTRDVKKMVGYAVSQSQQYGLKTERYNSLVKGRDIIVGKFKGTPMMSDKLIHHMVVVDELAGLNYFHHDTIMNAKGGTESAPALNVGGKQFPLSTAWRTVLESIEKSIANYGNRVTGHAGQPTDWKALSHAIRIGEQILELLDKGRIDFPRSNAKYLLDVKTGQVPLDEAISYLTHIFNCLDNAVAMSNLPDRTVELEEQFYEFKLNLLRDYYNLG